jgi:preprotein translocase subunit SecA
MPQFCSNGLLRFLAFLLTRQANTRKKKEEGSVSLKGLLRPLGLTFGAAASLKRQSELRAVLERRQQLSTLADSELKSAAGLARACADVVEVFAVAAEVAARVLGLEMFAVQLEGALALQCGHIAEMQTGEGKTLAAVPAVIWYACKGSGVHVLTANDYLARRDAAWMRPIYEYFGLSVAHLAQNMSTEARRHAYSADVTYATATEVGFDYLRDGLARRREELVQRPFAFALIDEADSTLIDEARTPLVLAGGSAEMSQLVYRADHVVRQLRFGIHYRLDEFARNTQLTDAGIHEVERVFNCGNLFDARNLSLLSSVLDALHAHALLKRDVDYVVKNGCVESVDEFKGRIAENRRWPAGLQTAIEAKEQVHLKPQGRILASITVQNLIAMYERICGMTGTAATQAEEFRRIYNLRVKVIPTNRPTRRNDLPDRIFATKQERNRAVLEEIRMVHQSGRPILVGTASVEESEVLSSLLHTAGVPHSVLNARNDEAEAELIAQAGAPGAVTISTNMAGRGTDIVLGGNPPLDRDKVTELRGLYVIGTTRHEAARIDNQLRGRAGRQGDPGTSCFFVSLEDDLLVRFGVAQNPDVDIVQRTAEGQNLQIREFLWKYEGMIEQHRREVYRFRREILVSTHWRLSSRISPAQYEHLTERFGERVLEEAGREIALALLEELWSDYLASVSELKSGIHWVSWGGGDPLHRFLSGVQQIYADFWDSLDCEIAATLEAAEVRNGKLDFHQGERFDRGATWTYVTTDQPFGTATERLISGLRRRLSRAGGSPNA